ncbi:Uncharacterised protein [Yersinia rohdei]|uniref:Uncharacterized protein n=1 Tax=Yersinia rohdei TaxID=29485 RepID=A0A0U1HVR9_YERRO|nr:Uncharacterised protein [Yersinia rohdei]CQI93129.1 Uncharacterised protein [Yersinia rohdei]CQJ53672.1 Uncharacterised protein [Yersinia rohdei]
MNKQANFAIKKRSVDVMSTERLRQEAGDDSAKGEGF